MMRHMSLSLVLLAASRIVSLDGQMSSPPPLAFPSPAPGITVTSDIEYGMSGTTRLAMDVYKPALAPGAKVPALVFFNRATGAHRSDRFYDGWARAAASKGLIGILPDLRDGSEAADFRILVSHLERHAAEQGIDSIAVYAGSGNVSTAFPVVEDPTLTAIKAAVMYYGTASVPQFRLDLPVLYVRAGLDRPSVNESMSRLAALAVAQNAPLTLLNYAGGHHGFEQADDNDATRQVIDDTLEFVTRTSSGRYQSALRASLPEVAAAGYMQTQKFHEAAAAYATMLAVRPDDARLRLSYGEALLADGQASAACGEFDKLRGKGLGYRDLGLPAARACLEKGDPDAAMAWLKSIPPQYLPASTGEDPAFAALRNRADFRALFERR
jgi:ribosomal protein S18 acetylase RimI-like enzyme